MPFDLQVPKRFGRVPQYEHIDKSAPFQDEIRFSVPCDTPGTAVVPICLNTSRLRSGDVFLFHSQSSTGKIIEAYQRLWCGLPKSASSVVHVGVYAGKGMIWDHNPSVNVRMRTVASSLNPGTTISVSRPKTSGIDQGRLTSICRYLQGQINYQVQTTTNWRAVLARANKTKFTKLQGNQVPSALVCSTFVATALDYSSLGRFTIPEAVVLPGDFVRSDRFDRLDIEWSRMPH